MSTVQLTASRCLLPVLCATLSALAAQPDASTVQPGPTTPSGQALPSRGRGVVNIINFIRGVEPRCEMDLLEPVVQQIRLGHELGLPTTFLIQYDALTQPRFVDLLKRELTDRDEIGAWLEVVQPQVEAAGLTWRGRFPWDWHTDVGFTVGYTPVQREKLIDVYMSKFRETFGRLPRSVGCWLIDAPTLNYLERKYHIVAACICKDQIGTDGYTLWGGYWNQAYYPSRLNAFMPAQTRENQVPVPVFRMLGSDPIYQYDHGLGGEAQGVVSLEPVYPLGGGSPAWVRWFFETNFAAPCLAFAYTQVGQENSFGWPAMSQGLTDQYRLVAEQSRAGRVRVETLQASGEWFRQTFPHTPSTAVTALRDYRPEKIAQAEKRPQLSAVGSQPEGSHAQLAGVEARRSVWYESRFYRVNLLWEGAAWRIRDIHLFDERYAERYLTERVTSHACTYDTLPVVDGFAWSSQERLAGMRPVLNPAAAKREPLATGDPSVTESNTDTLLITMPLASGGVMRIACEPRQMRFAITGTAVPTPWGLDLTWSQDKTVPVRRVSAREIAFEHNGYSYAMGCAKGAIVRPPDEERIQVRAVDGEIVLHLDTTKRLR